jgi:uncharacterized membrane protein
MARPVGDTVGVGELVGVTVTVAVAVVVAVEVAVAVVVAVTVAPALTEVFGANVGLTSLPQPLSTAAHVRARQKTRMDNVFRILYSVYQIYS